MMDWLKQRQRVKYQGKYSFHLLLNTQQVDSSSTISITCFADKSQRAAVPCNYIWFIIKNGLPQQVADFKGCTFICDTSCIGYYVQAHIISNDPDCPGKAIVTFGPVQLDVSLKTAILNAQSTGRLDLPLYFLGEDGEKEGRVELGESQIRLLHSFSQANYLFDYSILQPQIVPHPRDMARATFIFNQKYESQMRAFERRLFSPHDLTSSKSARGIGKGLGMSTAPKLEVRFLSRSARDTFFFAMKAFIAKKEIKHSAVIRKIESINFEKEEDFNAILQIDNLKGDLLRYDRLYKQALQDKRKLQEEVTRLQRELERAKPDLSMNVNYSATTRRQDPKREIPKSKRISDELDHHRNNASAILEPPMALSPFSRRKEDDNESLAGLLADLSNCEPEKQIVRLQQEKRALELRLEKSFQKIGHLQQRLRPSILPTPLGINFTYKGSPCCEQLRQENQQLRRTIAELQGRGEVRLESHLSRIRQQNRTTDLLAQQQRLGAQVGALRGQLQGRERQLGRAMQRCVALQRRAQEAEMQIEMFRKNQDVLNRSQHMSQQMENYNQEQIRMLKEHNGFLLQENEKLVRACEKYMGEAKQNNKLRQQIITLKERISKMLTNPESSFQ